MLISRACLFASSPKPPPPTLTSISPGIGDVAGGTTITLTGTNFRAGMSVVFGGTAGTSVNVTSPTSATVVAPAKALSDSVGKYAVVATTRGGSTDGAVKYDAWDPISQSGHGGLTLVQYLDSETVHTVSGAADSWTDLSGAGNSATQGTAANRPAYISGATSTGLHALQGDGVSKSLQCTFILNQPCSTFLVARYDTAFSAQRSLLDGAAVNQGGIFRDAQNSLNAYAGGASLPNVSSYNSQQWNQFALVMSQTPGEMVFSVNGTASATTTIGASNPGGTVLFANGALTSFAAASAASLLRYTGSASSVVQQLVRKWQKARFGTP